MIKKSKFLVKQNFLVKEIENIFRDFEMHRANWKENLILDNKLCKNENFPKPMVIEK